MPKGILKTAWVRKHLFEVPAVAVLFFELDFDDVKWNLKEDECVAKVSNEGIASSMFELFQLYFFAGGTCPATAEWSSVPFSISTDPAKCQSSR